MLDKETAERTEADFSSVIEIRPIGGPLGAASALARSLRRGARRPSGGGKRGAASVEVTAAAAAEGNAKFSKDILKMAFTRRTNAPLVELHGLHALRGEAKVEAT